MPEPMNVFPGRLIDPLALRHDDISIDTIAHALARLCRFGGHTREFYSVAQHSVLVARQCPREHRLWGLLHDAAEAYLGDVVSPLKDSPLFPEYRLLEERTLHLVAEVFGLPWPVPEAVWAADQLICQVEMRDLLVRRPHHPEVTSSLALELSALPAIEPWWSDVSERRFLDLFHVLATQSQVASR